MAILYIVATPIGNLEDITLRALEALKNVDSILCEDTRHTAILLNRYNIKKPLISYHQHSRLGKFDLIAEKLTGGENLALVSDAGTPGIADPGNELIARLIKRLGSNLQIIPIPGPVTIATALSISGFDCSKFLFLGFLPKKKGRQTLLKKISGKDFEDFVLVIYESPHRIIKTLTELGVVLGSEREAVVCRELTKKFEEIKRGNLNELVKYFSIKQFKGEFVIVIDKL